MERVKEFLLKNKFVFLVLLIGLALILWPSGGEKKAGTAEIAAVTPLEREEERMESILGEARGVGKIRVMLGERDGAVIGCVIVCEGADERTVTLFLTEAASRLTGLGADKIKVITMKGGVT